MPDTDAPDTLRSCEACGGGPLTDECQWCTDGFQNGRQYGVWAEFRKRMKHISGTYSFLQTSVQDVLGRLIRRGTPEALDLHAEGSDLLSAWLCADPMNGGRDQVTDRLSEYQRRALDYLMATAPTEYPPG